MATQKRSDQQRGGRYVQGGSVTVTGGNKLGWWERKILPRDNSDIPFTITPKYAQRPDRLAFDLYGRADLQWFILQYNNVVDLYLDFTVGKTIVLPTKARLYAELLSKQTTI